MKRQYFAHYIICNAAGQPVVDGSATFEVEGTEIVMLDKLSEGVLASWKDKEPERADQFVSVSYRMLTRLSDTPCVNAGACN